MSVQVMFSDALYFFGAHAINTYIGFVEFTIRIRERHVSAWKNLTRPLKPTTEEKAYNDEVTQQAALIAHLNQDIAHYNHNTWWAEYNQARAYNVN